MRLRLAQIRTRMPLRICHAAFQNLDNLLAAALAVVAASRLTRQEGDLHAAMRGTGKDEDAATENVRNPLVICVHA